MLDVKAGDYVYDSQGNAYRLGSLGGDDKGGEGRVFSIEGADSMVAKIYFQDKRESRCAKVEAMLGMRSISTKNGSFSLAWPNACLFSSENMFLGFMMPKLSSSARPLHSVVMPLEYDLPKQTWGFNLRVAKNLFLLLSHVHSNGLVIGDINTSNIFVGDDAELALIDCDSMQIIHGGKTYKCPVAAKGFSAPELLIKAKSSSNGFSDILRTPEMDIFSIAILVTQLLYLGRTPFYQEDDFEKAIERGETWLSTPGLRLKSIFYDSSIVAPEVLDLLMKTLVQGHANPSLRPSAGEWVETLERLCGEVIVCTSQTAHAFSAHHVRCPWCEFANQFGWDPWSADGASSDFVIGLKYRDGDGVERNYEKAFAHLKIAADEGHARAQSCLGDMYQMGWGVDQDYQEALYWFRSSASKACSDAEATLGYMYENGFGVSEDSDAALDLYRKSAHKGNLDGQTCLGSFLIFNSFGQDDIAEGQKWLMRAAENGHMGAQLTLGYLCLEGDLIPEDEKQGFYWIKCAAEQSLNRPDFEEASAVAKYWLGYCYFEGAGVAVDYAMAIDYFKEAANAGEPRAQFRLGYMYQEGVGALVDLREAAYWYEKAANNGDLDAELQLVVSLAKLAEQTGAEDIKEKASYWIYKLSDENELSASALFVLAACFEGGWGVSEDLDRAVKLYEAASEKGHEEAAERLSILLSDRQTKSVFFDTHQTGASFGSNAAEGSSGLITETDLFGADEQGGIQSFPNTDVSSQDSNLFPASTRQSYSSSSGCNFQTSNGSWRVEGFERSRLFWPSVLLVCLILFSVIFWVSSSIRDFFLGDDSAPSQPGTQVVEQVETFVVAVEGLNLRSEPNTEADVIRVLPQGEPVFRLNPTNDHQWFHVRPESGSEVGWVAARFLERVTDESPSSIGVVERIKLKFLTISAVSSYLPQLIALCLGLIAAGMCLMAAIIDIEAVYDNEAQALLNLFLFGSVLLILALVLAVGAGQIVPWGLRIRYAAMSWLLIFSIPFILFAIWYVRGEKNDFVGLIGSLVVLAITVGGVYFIATKGS